jgi:hypothetical protein
MKTFEESFQEYYNAVYPYETSEIQKREVKQAAYAGAMIFINLGIASTNEHSLNEDLVFEDLEKLKNEIHTFLFNKAFYGTNKQN